MANASQTTADLKGDLLSVKMFGAVGDGTTDDSTAFQDAIDYLTAKGGGVIRVPKTDGASYVLSNPVTIKDKVILVGEGDGSVLFRGANMPAGDGVIIIDGVDAGVQDLKIDGNVTTSVNLLYGAGTSTVLFNNDPMDSKLTLNTSIWVRPGADNLWISGMTITHTGGYSILLDAQNGDILNASILDCFFENNRPHLFGVDAGTPANNVYGAWTSGIFAKGDCRSSAGKLFAVRGLIVRGCYFHRMNGNCVWSHSYGFDTQHENFQLDNNVFRYIARDGYMVGNVTGGHARGTMKYVGFTHSTDIDAPVGAYLSDNYAVGFDAAGFVSNFEFSGDVSEVYGGAFDLDGVRNSTVISPNISSSQPITKGIQTGDSSVNGGGANVRIIGGHISGCNAGSVVLNQAKGCLLSGVTINHPAGAPVVPILLYSLDKNTKNTVVTGNVITYPDANFCIAESDAGTGTGFDSGTRNYVFANTCLGANKGEFYKDANSASTTGMTFTSNVATPTDRSEFFIQREGQGGSAALKGYTINTSTSKQRFQWQDYRDGSTEDSVLNISLNGGADTGIVALGDRTTFGFGDVFAGGHMLGYGFMAILGKTATGNVYSDTRADTYFNNDWALLRFDESVPRLEMSVVTSAGSRVWVPIGGGGTPGGSNTHIQFNDEGSFGGVADFVWNKTTQVLTVTGLTGTAGIVAATSFIQSAEGFYSPGTAADTVNIPSGGVTALSLIAVRNDAADAWTIARTSATARQYGISINASGELIITDVTGGSARMKVTTAGVFQWGGTDAQIDQSGNISITAVLSSTGASGGVNVSAATASNAIQAPSGGVTAKYLVTTESIFGTAVAAPALSGAGQGKLHFNSSANKWQYSENGSSWAACFGTGTVAGGDREIQFNSSSAFAASSLFKYNSGGAVQIGSASDDGSGAKLQVTGFVRATTGFASPGTAADTVNIPSGGVTALSLISVRNDADSGLVLSRTSATAREYGLGINSSGVLVLRDRTGAADRLTMSTAGVFTIGATLVIDQSGNLTMSGVLNCNGASGGVNVSSNSSYNCIQASNSGGMAARSFTATTYIQMGQSSGAPSATTSDSLNDGCLYYDTSTAKARVRIAGSFVDIATGAAGGVTSLNSLTGALSIGAGTAINVTPAGSTITITNTGVTFLSAGSGISLSGSTGSITVTNSGVTFLSAGTGVSVTANTGSITVSIGQAVATSSNVTFASVTTGSGGVVQSGATGTSISFQNTNFNFQVNGNGVISCQQLNVAGSTAINSSRQFVGAGALCGSSGIGAGGFNPWNGSGYDTGATGTITSSFSSITVKGGVITGWS